MFTGITEEKGKILNPRSPLVIAASRITNDLSVGDSVAVNGVCLTVTSFNKNSFSLDVMNETYKKTNLGLLKCGDYVNLERAMPLNGRFGGHIVSGHVDGTGEVKHFYKDGIATIIEIKAPIDILKYIIPKGSVTLNGVSLTVVSINNSCFSVSLIPHTRLSTTFERIKNGDIINIENDIVGKYIEKFLNTEKKEITKDFLSENGFLGG